ncbi:FAD-binding protein [Amylibacter sp.]|nr:FAD-binding protein [Amylibacter sp.]
MATLLLAEINGFDLCINQTAKAVTAAKRLGDITILCASSECGLAAEVASKIEGVTGVICANDTAYDNGLAEPLADLIVSLASDYEHIIAPATVFGKNILPRVAALLDVMIISDVTNIINKNTFERPIYAGNAIQLVQSSDKIKVVSIRTSGFDIAAENGSASIKNISSNVRTNLSEWVEDKIIKSDRPDLTSAKIVVSGGRGVGSEGNFMIIEKLADKLGAAVGASRAAVDSGFAPNDWQVGQTGKVVAPDLYIAVGISGAIQHLAGMKDSKVIVAINNDEEAPIFDIADYGLIADMFDALPKFCNEIDQQN